MDELIVAARLDVYHGVPLFVGAGFQALDDGEGALVVICAGCVDDDVGFGRPLSDQFCVLDGAADGLDAEGFQLGGLLVTAGEGVQFEVGTGFLELAEESAADEAGADKEERFGSHGAVSGQQFRSGRKSMVVWSITRGVVSLEYLNKYPRVLLTYGMCVVQGGGGRSW